MHVLQKGNSLDDNIVMVIGPKPCSSSYDGAPLVQAAYNSILERPEGAMKAEFNIFLATVTYVSIVSEDIR